MIAPGGPPPRFGLVERKACPACASLKRAILVDMPLDGPVIGPLIALYYLIDPALLHGGRYVVAECAHCATIYHAEVGDEALLGTLYDDWLNAVEDSDDQAGLDWLADHPRQSRDGHELMAVAAMLKQPLASLKTLDFGMGKGLWAGIARRLGCASLGFDLSETRMRLARQKGITTIALDAIPGADFDFVNTEQVMEHVTAVRPVMDSLAQGLRVGGILKISVPAQGSVRGVLARVAAGELVSADSLMPTLPLQHVNAFSVAGLTMLGEAFGLKKVSPGLAQRARFARDPRNWLSSKPKNIVKELVRPFVPFENNRNTTVWLMKR